MESQVLSQDLQDAIVTGEQIRRFLNRWIVPTASVVVACTALLGLIRHIIRSEVSDMTGDIQTLNENVKSIRTDLHKNSNKIDGGLSKANDRIDNVLTKALERAFPLPQSSKEKIRGSLDEIRGLLQFAMQQNIKLNPLIIAAYGRQVTGIAADPNVFLSAWETSLSLLNYRSFLNVHSSPEFLEMRKLAPKQGLNVDINFRPLSPPPARNFPPGTTILGFMMWAHGAGVAPQDAAIWEKISKPLGPGATYAFYMFDGQRGSLTLDDQKMRNVTVYNAVIEYNGGPVDLENVYFVDCIFRVRYTPNGTHFGNELLASASTTFRARS